MGFLNNLEHEYVLGNLTVYNEFDSSHFISNAKSAITNKAEVVNVNLKFSYYTDMIEKAIQSFSTIKLDKSRVKDFLIKATDSNIDYTNITSHNIDTHDVSIFKPQYISQYVNIVKDAIDKSLNGNLSASDSMKFMANEYVLKVEKQIIKTNIPYGLTCKDLQKETLISSEFVPVDRVFIKDKVIPFVTKYDDTKSSTLVEANAVLNAIKEAEVNIKAMLTVLNKARTNENINFENIKKTNQVAYNAIRGIIDIISFTSFMLIHKLNVISTNVITCNKLYDDVFNSVNVDAMESAFDNTVIPNDNSAIASDLIDGRTSAFDVLADNIYNYHKGMIDLNNIDINDKIDSSDVLDNNTDDNYSKAPYEDTIKAFEEISKGLDNLSKEGGEYLLVFDDIINKSGFRMMLQDKYKNLIDSIMTMSLYDGANNLTMNGVIDSNVYKSIMSEVKDYSTNMGAIANVINNTFKKLSLIQERFATNINGEYSDLETINELRLFMKDLREQFIILVQELSNNFMARLQKLGKILVDMDVANDNTNVDTTTPDYILSNDDITESVFEIEYESMVEENNERFKALQRSYIIEKSLTLSNEKVIFEDENASTNNGTGTQDNNQNSTKPVVTDNNEEVKSNTQNSGNVSGSLKDSISNIINKIIEVFSNAFEKQSVKNAKFINDNKDALTNRSYSNTATRVVPYSKDAKAIIADLEGVKNKINALTPQVIQSASSEADIYTKIIQFSGGVKPDNLGSQITNYFTMGNTTSVPSLKEYTNNAVHDLVVNTMIPFCTDYSSETTKTSFIQALQDLQKAVSDKCDAINTQTTQESVSIFTEADNPNAQASMTEKMKWVNKAVSEMCQAARTVLQTQNNDYLKVLNAFMPKVTNGEAKVTDGNDSGEQAQNQQPQQNQNQPNQ